MDALHYVCVDAPSNYFAVWMTYHTYHSYMDTLHYVCIDVSSNNSSL